MPYDPSIYNPYGLQQPVNPYPQQPVNGLVWIENGESAQSYPMPPNSTSPALMHKYEPKFSVKTTDASGNGVVRTFSFTEDEPAKRERDGGAYVTLADFEQFKREVLEATHGKPVVPADQLAAGQQPAAAIAADQVNGPVVGGLQPDVQRQPSV